MGMVVGMDVARLNKAAWDAAVDEGSNPFTHAVPATEVAAARSGEWVIRLSDRKPVPTDWFPPLQNCRVLCLASGGGQQGPILAAAGATVTVVDMSRRQLDQDADVARRDGLEMTLLEGDMADLSRLGTGSFDLVVNPPSTLFVPELAPIFAECRRMLAPGGVLIMGFMNPDEFVFDHDVLDREGTFVVSYPLPYVEIETLSAAELSRRIHARAMFHFSHTMEAQLGGLLRAGFVVTGFYEDRRSDEDGNPIRHYMPSVFVVRAHAIEV